MLRGPEREGCGGGGLFVEIHQNWADKLSGQRLRDWSTNPTQPGINNKKELLPPPLAS